MRRDNADFSVGNGSSSTSPTLLSALVRPPPSFYTVRSADSPPSPGSVLFATEEHDVTARYCEWLGVLTDAVSYHLGEDFTFVVEEKLVGVRCFPLPPTSHSSPSSSQLYTVIFSKTSLKSSIKDLATHRIKTGFDGEVGNKVRSFPPTRSVFRPLTDLLSLVQGALLFRFVVDDTSFCFINAHLAAGEGREDDRVRDLTAILDGYKFPKAKEGTRSAYLDDGDGTMVFHCETVFLAGATTLFSSSSSLRN